MLCGQAFRGDHIDHVDVGGFGDRAPVVNRLPSIPWSDLVDSIARNPEKLHSRDSIAEQIQQQPVRRGVLLCHEARRHHAYPYRAIAQ
jgi:hypothetical protein